MPGAGSASFPPGGGPPAPLDIGEVANPPLAILPDPATLFHRRAARLRELAGGHEIEGYLRWIATIVEAQHACLAALPDPRLPSNERIAQAYEHAMPPLAFAQLTPDDVTDATLSALVDRLLASDVPPASRVVLDRVKAMDRPARDALIAGVVADEIPEDRVGEHVIAAAALQVHLARMASRLDVSRLQRVADAACPACGSAPVASMVVGYEGASGTRFCTCSVCSTQWHVVRIQCLVCGTDKGMAYQGIEGASDLVRAETCGECHSYVKILAHNKNAALEPFADDVATLGLDMVLGKEGWQRAAANPFLMGY